MASADRFGAFLLQLVVSSEHRTAFLNASDADKKKIMDKFGLTQAQEDAILSGDLGQILQQLYYEFGPKPGDFTGPPW